MAQQVTKLHRAKKKRDDEFYTPRWMLERIFENVQLKEYFRDKVVYLPCDTERSYIYLYLIENQQVMGIKEILRTYDDYYGHLDLYERADIVFTNPPFSNLANWERFLRGLGKKYILFFPFTIFWATTKDIIERMKSTHIIYPRLDNFERPDGTIGGPSCFIGTNDLTLDEFVYHKNNLLYDETKYEKINGIVEFNKKVEIPDDYEGLAYIPITSYYGNKHRMEPIKYEVIRPSNKLRLLTKIQKI